MIGFDRRGLRQIEKDAAWQNVNSAGTAADAATTAARRSHFTTSSQTGVLKLAASAGGIGSCAVVRGGLVLHPLGQPLGQDLHRLAYAIGWRCDAE